MSRLERSESARMNMFMFIHIYIYVYEYARIFICQYTYMVSIDGHMHLCDSSSRQFRIVLKPLEHILTMWLYQYLSLFKHRQSKLSIRCSNVIFTSSVSFWCFFSSSKRHLSSSSWTRSLHLIQCRLYLLTRLGDSVDVKIGTGKSKTFQPASFEQVHMIKHKRQSNSIKFTRFFRSMTVRDFSPFLPPPVAAVPSQEAFLYQTEEPKKNQQSGRSTDCGGQGKIFSQNMRIYIYI